MRSVHHPGGAGPGPLQRKAHGRTPIGIGELRYEPFPEGRIEGGLVDEVNQPEDSLLVRHVT